MSNADPSSVQHALFDSNAALKYKECSRSKQPSGFATHARESDPIITVSTEKVIDFGLTRAIQATVTGGTGACYCGRNRGNRESV